MHLISYSASSSHCSSSSVSANDVDTPNFVKYLTATGMPALPCTCNCNVGLACLLYMVSSEWLSEFPDLLLSLIGLIS